MGTKIRPNRIFWTFLEHRPCRNRFWTFFGNGPKILAKHEQNPLKLAPKIVSFKKKKFFYEFKMRDFGPQNYTKLNFSNMD